VTVRRVGQPWPVAAAVGPSCGMTSHSLSATLTAPPSPTYILGEIMSGGVSLTLRDASLRRRYLLLYCSAGQQSYHPADRSALTSLHGYCIDYDDILFVLNHDH
jgi:hypothetical protein